eukprot:scaffold941_cov81-Phaeocystis_antarctica.AAC.2
MRPRRGDLCTLDDEGAQGVGQAVYAGERVGRGAERACEVRAARLMVGALRAVAHSIEGGLQVAANGFHVGHDNAKRAAALVLTRGEEVVRLVAVEQVTTGALISVLRPLGCFPVAVAAILDGDVEVLLPAPAVAGRGLGVSGGAGAVAIVARGSGGMVRLCLKVGEAAEDGFDNVLLTGAVCIGPLSEERDGGEDLLLGATRASDGSQAAPGRRLPSSADAPPATPDSPAAGRGVVAPEADQAPATAAGAAGLGLAPLYRDFEAMRIDSCCEKHE